MRIRQGTVTVSATDLANHLSCRHLTALNLRLAKGEIPEPSWDNPHLRFLQERGAEHEKAYIESLRSKGIAIADLSQEPEETAAGATWAAMSSAASRAVSGTGHTRLWIANSPLKPKRRPFFNSASIRISSGTYRDWSRNSSMSSGRTSGSCPSPIACLPSPPITASSKGLWNTP